MRRVAAACVILLVSFGVAVAEEFQAFITKVDGNKVTFQKALKKGERGEAMTLPVADNVKIVKGKINEDTKKLEAGDPIEGGLKADAFTKIGEKGMNARITTDDGKITQIIVGGKKKKKAN